MWCYTLLDQAKEKRVEEEKMSDASNDNSGTYNVKLAIYDLTQGMARQLGPALLGK